MRLIPLRAAVVMASIYGYFLIFAQFSFVELVRADFAAGARGTLSAGTTEKLVLGAMALAGILAGFGVAWKGASPLKIRVALVIAAVASACAPYVTGLPGLLVVSIFTGLAIGVSTVSAATLVRSWCGLLWVGIGTGMGYACCNLPFIFSQSPLHQAWIAAAFALAGACCVPPRGEACVASEKAVFPVASVLVLFTALVWMDSAAFFIIQHTRELKDSTWNSDQLWRNAAIHLASAILAGCWLKRGGAMMIPAAAWVLLAIAALAVNVASGRELAGWIYPLAVSLYSTALVAWPGWFSGAENERVIAWRAAWIYAVAGWIGSANGIGMAQSLQRVPREFIVIAGVCVMAALMLSHRRNVRIAGVAGIVIATSLLPKETPDSPGATAEARGKQVYLSEGCIHCHSQYIRPGTRDQEDWGPAHSRESVMNARPVLIGNRRQGPDLSNIGARRSAQWLKQHFIHPELFSHDTVMPSYAHLFGDGRGDDLVAYMKQCGSDEAASITKTKNEWRPATRPTSENGPMLFANQCAVCHGLEGKGNGRLSGSLVKPPANLVNGPFIWSAPSPDMELVISRIIKFGIPGTDMPGHEVLTDEQVEALKKHVVELRK